MQETEPGRYHDIHFGEGSGYGRDHKAGQEIIVRTAELRVFDQHGNFLSYSAGGYKARCVITHEGSYIHTSRTGLGEAPYVIYATKEIEAVDEETKGHVFRSWDSREVVESEG